MQQFCLIAVLQDRVSNRIASVIARLNP